MKLNKMFFGFMLYITISLIIGCSSAPVKKGSLEDVKAPEWTRKGSGAFDEKDNNIFYGVGSANGIKNYSLLRTAADNRARNEIAKVFEFYIASLMKDYAASTTAGDFDNTSEEQHVEQAIKTIANQTLSGVSIVDRWEHPYKDELYALARLDLDKFKDNIDRMKELNSEVKEYVRKNADKLHDELGKEEKYRGKNG